MKTDKIKEVSEITLYYGGKREEKQIVAGYINIDKPLFGSTLRNYIIKTFHNRGSFWSLISEEKMKNNMKSCICIKKACYQVDTSYMEQIATNLKTTHKMVELNLFKQ